ncbi:MAG: cytochrome c biogenesis protein CcsA [Acidobacteria bacterium]|nr:cytochrome c biogenesis protein CcsA [Acidobacteriota bacterium]
MKKRVAILSSAAAAVLLTASAALAAPETFSFDKGHSLVGFRIRHFVSKVEGRFREYDGTISLDRQSPAASSRRTSPSRTPGPPPRRQPNPAADRPLRPPTPAGVLSADLREPALFFDGAGFRRGPLRTVESRLNAGPLRSIRLDRRMEWHALGWLAVALYVGAEALSVLSLLKPGRASSATILRTSAASVLLAAGLALHFADLEITARMLHSVPYQTFGGSLSLFGWMLGVSYLALLFRHRERAIGPFLIPFVILFSAAGLLLPMRAAAPDSEMRGSLFAMHVTFGILGYAAFTFSFVLSILYLVQDRQIRRGRTGILFARLPPLEVIGKMNRTSVTIGIAVLAASVLFGLLWANRVWATMGDPKIEWAIATLALYGFLLWMERRGWKGPRVAILSILGYGLVLFSYTIVNMFFSRSHGFR